MALKKPSNPAPTATPAPAAPAGKFEDSSTTVVVEQPAQPAEAAQAAAGVAASTAIAKAATTGLARQGKLETLFSEHRNAIPPMEFGTLPRLVGTNGNVQDRGEGKLLGESVVIELVSWNEEFVVSPGSDKEEAKALVRYSLDGKTIDATGESVASYLEKLRTVEGYSDASIKRYVQLIGIVESTAKASELVGQMVQVSLSPQSAKLFDGYRMQESVKLRLRPELKEQIDNRLKVTAEVKQQGSNTFTLLKVGAAPKA